MATNFLPKQVLFDQLTQIYRNRETGFLTILTDSKRSVLLRFYSGRLTHCNARSKDVSEAIQVLIECELVKFTYVAGAVENRPELMPTEDFLQLINPGGGGGGSSVATQAPAAPPVAAAPAPVAAPAGSSTVDPALYQALSTIAEEYLGLVGDMVVADALKKNQPIEAAINEIAESIPDSTQADAFRASAWDHVPNI